jgi:hypothetical protein
MSVDNMGGRSLTEREMWEQGKIKLTDEQLKERGWLKESPKEAPKEVSNK